MPPAGTLGGSHRARVGSGDRRWFRFRHALLQVSAYESLLKSDRRALHDQIVTATSKEPDPQLPDEVMAWHCEQAGRLHEAARYAIRAAERFLFASPVVI